MKRRSFLATLPLAAAAAVAESNAMAVPYSTDHESNTAPDLPALKFRADGSFKILAISDTHYWPQPDKYGMAFTEYLIDTEKPDFVIVNGDVITGNDSHSPEDVKQAIANAAEVMERKQMPWAITFGNHDRENQKEHHTDGVQQIALYESYPYNRNAGWVRGINGQGNKNLLVMSADGAKPLFNIWLLDSGDGNDRPGQWVCSDQVAWYRETSVKLEKQYGAPIPSLMFFHIPFQELREMTEHHNIIGERKEPISRQSINGGIFSAVLERGDVKGIFFGHDHINNFLGRYRGMLMGYDGVAGFYTYPNIAPTDPVNGRARCGRLFKIKASNPGHITTWLRFRDGSINWEFASADYLIDEGIEGTWTGPRWAP